MPSAKLRDICPVLIVLRKLFLFLHMDKNHIPLFSATNENLSMAVVQYSDHVLYFVSNCVIEGIKMNLAFWKFNVFLGFVIRYICVFHLMSSVLS